MYSSDFETKMSHIIKRKIKPSLYTVEGRLADIIDPPDNEGNDGLEVMIGEYVLSASDREVLVNALRIVHQAKTENDEEEDRQSRRRLN